MEADPQPSKEPNTFPVYSKSLFFKTQLVLEHSNRLKKNMDEFIGAFTKRAQAEQTYQRNLLECGKTLEKYIQPTTNKSTSFIASAFKVDNQQRATQAYQLAQSLKTQVIEPLSVSTKQLAALMKKIQKSTKKLGKDYVYFSENLQRTEKNYVENDNTVKQMIITKNIQRYTSEFSQDKKNKLVSKTMESIKQKSQYDKQYRAAVSQFNQLVQIYFKENTSNLDELQTMERELIKAQSDAIRKLIVCEVSMFKNVEYDIINISKQMEKIYPENDVLDFKNKMQNVEETEKDKNLTFKTIDSDKSLLHLSLRSVEEQYYPWLLTVKKNKTLRLALESRLKILKMGERAEYQNQQKQQKKQTKEEQKQENEQKQKKRAKSSIQIENQISNKEQESIKKQQAEETQDKTDKSNPSQVIKNVNPKQKKTPTSEIIPIKSNETEEQTFQSLSEKFINTWQSLPNQIFSPPPHPSGGLFTVLDKKQVLKDFKLISTIIHQAWFCSPNQNQQSTYLPQQARKSKSLSSSSITSPKLRKSLNSTQKIIMQIIGKNPLIRILCALYIQQYITQHHVLIQWKNYNKTAQIMKTILDACQQHNDVFVMRCILSCIFTFYSVENEKVKKMLFQNQNIRDSELWKKNDCWDASIFQSTYEIMAGFNVQVGETQADTLLRQKNMIFNQLASYCHYMLMLGVTSRNVRVTVGRFCRLYEMSDDQNRDLSKMISNTTKQIKQTQMITQAKNQTG